ncbi:hypothetical protein BN1708_020046, partial [Verticillium longisporum]
GGGGAEARRADCRGEEDCARTRGGGRGVCR